MALKVWCTAKQGGEDAHIDCRPTTTSLDYSRKGKWQLRLLHLRRDSIMKSWSRVVLSGGERLDPPTVSRTHLHDED